MKRIAAVGAAIQSWAPDVLMLSGVTGMSYGAWLVYAPAGFIVGGAFLLAGGVLAARRGA